jgi:uncharacterized membrane protein
LAALNGTPSTQPARLTSIDALRGFVMFMMIFGHPRWYSVTLSTERAVYRPMTATHNVAHATSSPAGETCVSTGDVLLVPNAE